MAATHDNLSRDLSRLVTDARGGVVINPKVEGAELAARYPDLRATPEMMEQAIIRTAAMVQVWLGDGPRPQPQVVFAPLQPAPDEREPLELEAVEFDFSNDVETEAEYELEPDTEQEPETPPEPLRRELDDADHDSRQLAARFAPTPSNIERVRMSYQNRIPDHAAIPPPSFSFRSSAAAVRRLLFRG